jgi:hypothetical protein
VRDGMRAMTERSTPGIVSVHLAPLIHHVEDGSDLGLRFGRPGSPQAGADAASLFPSCMNDLYVLFLSSRISSIFVSCVYDSTVMLGRRKHGLESQNWNYTPHPAERMPITYEQEELRVCLHTIGLASNDILIDGVETTPGRLLLGSCT